MSKTVTTIVVTLQVEGVHRWPDAVNLKGVEFLANPHRHIFHITAEKVVNHDDRDIEIILFKRRLIQHINTKWRNATMPDWRTCVDFDTMSCEMIARSLMADYELHSCSVLEDGENGAKIYMTPNN